MELTELYGGSFEGFVSRRSALAKEAKAVGGPEAAKVIKALRKPTRGAWLIDLLARHEASALEDFLALGEAFASAHRTLSMEEIRRLSALRSTKVDNLVARATALARDHGYTVPPTVGLEVGETLVAALLDPKLAQIITHGVLVTTERAAGFGPADLMAPLAKVVPLHPDKPARASSAGEAATEDRGMGQSDRDQRSAGETRQLERELGRVEVRLADGREKLSAAYAELESATGSVTRARGVADEQARLVARLQAELERAGIQQQAAEAAFEESVHREEKAAAAATRWVDEVELLGAQFKELQKRLGELEG